MVLYLQKYDVVPGKTDEFIEWAKTAIPRIMRRVKSLFRMGGMSGGSRRNRNAG